MKKKYQSIKRGLKLLSFFLFLFACAVFPANLVKAADDSPYNAQRVILSPKTIIAAGGEQAKIILGFRNTGKDSWSKFRFTASDAEFVDASWESEEAILSGEEEILSDAFLRKNIYFRAPAKKGDYVFKLVLDIDNGKLRKEISVPVTVTADVPIDYQAPNLVDSQNEEKIKTTMSLSAEPRLRVGINAPEGNFMQFRSYEDEYKVYAGEELKGILPVKKFAVVKFNNGAYSFQGGDLVFSTDKFVRLQPINNPHAVFIIPNLTRTAKWVNPSASFNVYRGTVEYRQGKIDKKMYVINDLFLEDYVKGMAENSLLAPMEFLKANLTAARNYAYVSIGKYPFFDVIANTYDQLYLGKEAEDTLPNVVAAAEATRGVFVTYENEIVTTPYFGNSNGWTKSWKNVWGGTNKPWLAPVRANYDTGKRQNGHGVGMSQLDAYNRVKNENVDFVDLLKYYYTGTKLEKMY